MIYYVAVYEIGCAYGGPEEGGWWYDTGELSERVRVRGYRTRDQASAVCRRINGWLDRMRADWVRSPRSVVYAGGHFEARVYKGLPPKFFPQSRPFYE